MWYLVGILGIAGMVSLLLYSMYYMVFRRNRMTILDDRTLPEGEQYEPYAEGILKGIERMLPEAFQEVWIISYDGLKLYGRYYELYQDAPVILFFHGYRSSSVRDGNGIFALCQEHGYNLLMVDQRAHGRSEGKTITFGVRERYDVLQWIDYLVKEQGKNVQIVLAGISMGAATVLMASDLELPDNVRCILADCPYSAPGEILKCVMKSLKLPAGILYPVARLSGRIFGKVDMEAAAAINAVKRCKIPILFIHGDDDRFVPCDMSRQCYDACTCEKRIVFVKNAGHGISYCVDGVLYKREVLACLEKWLED